ncbi:MAG: hypothetical protein ACLPVO_09385 [Desulfomonilaceae bacterium]
MRVDRKEAVKNLAKKGFVKKDSRKHVFYNCYYQGKDTGIATCFSHGSKGPDIGPDILKSMKKQLKLAKIQEVEDLLNCPMTKESYFNVLKEKGFLI